MSRSTTPNIYASFVSKAARLGPLQPPTEVGIEDAPGAPEWRQVPETDFHSSPSAPQAPDTWYHTDDYKTLKQSLESTSIKYSSVSSTIPRFGGPTLGRNGLSHPLDKMYEVDKVGPKKSMYRAIVDSPLRYSGKGHYRGPT